jgi:hypothetical protein
VLLALGLQPKIKCILEENFMSCWNVYFLQLLDGMFFICFLSSFDIWCNLTVIFLSCFLSR